MQGLRRWPALLGFVCIVSGCVTEQHHDTHSTATADKTKTGTAQSGTAPGTASVENKEQSKTPASNVGSGPVPSAPPIAGGVGYYQDRQQALLIERLASSGVHVQRNADTIKLIVSGKLAFALNSEQILPSFAAVLDSIAQVLKEYSKTVVDIKGYTDSTGSFEHNQALSEHRAQSLGTYLSAHQVAAARIRSAGYGPRNPLAGNDSESGRSQNRRVEIELVPMP